MKTGLNGKRLRESVLVPIALLLSQAAAAQRGDEASDAAFEAALRGPAPLSQSRTKAERQTPPGSASSAPMRHMNPLAGLASNPPADIVDALLTCLKVVDGTPIEPAAMHALGWKSVVNSAPDMLPDARYYARPSKNLQIMISKTGDNAKVCTTIGVIGGVGNKAELESLVTRRLGAPSQGASAISSAGSMSWATAKASVVMDINALTRGGVHRAWVVVHPLGMRP